MLMRRVQQLPLMRQTSTQVAATYEDNSAAEPPPEETQTAGVVRTRVTAARCVEQAVAAAKAELAQLAAQAERIAGATAEEAGNGAVSTDRAGNEAREQPGPVRRSNGGMSHEDGTMPESSPSSSEESSQVCDMLLNALGERKVPEMT